METKIRISCLSLFLMLIFPLLLKSRIVRHLGNSFTNFAVILQNTALDATFNTIENIYVMECKSECITNDRCKSINFNQERYLCQLNDKAEEDPADGISTHARLGWTYYSTFKYDEKVSCGVYNGYDPCSIGEACSHFGRCPWLGCNEPSSCLLWYKRGARINGVYYILSNNNNNNNNNKNVYPVYCDFTTERLFVWTLVSSWALQYNAEFLGALFWDNKPYSDRKPNFKKYRLSSDKIRSIRSSSTHWRGTCAFEKYQVDYRDYFRVSLNEVDPLTFYGYGQCKRVEHIDIRGNSASSVTVAFWQLSREVFHTDSSIKLCEYDARKNSVRSEDNFGLHHYINRGFRCTASASSTTQQWLGEYK